MRTRPAVLAALTFVTATGLVATAPAHDPPPARADKTNLSATVAALNHIFRQNADGTVAKKYVGRVVTVSGKVKGVTATSDGGQEVALDGLPPTATDPGGCRITFPAGHPSLDAVQGLTAGAAVRVKGTIGGVTGSAFTLTNPILLPAPAAVAQANPPATRPAPPATKTTPPAASLPAVNPPAANPTPPVVNRTPPGPRPDPVPNSPALKPGDVKTTVVALTTRLRDDTTGEAARAYFNQDVEVTGQVQQSFRPTKESGAGWGLWLLGCPSKIPNQPYRLMMSFPADSPDLPRLKNLAEGDTVTVRGVVGLIIGPSIPFSDPTLVAGGDKAAPPLVPVRTADATAFAKELLTDPAAADKLRGQAVALTGAVSTADPKYSRHGLSLTAGKLKPTDQWGVFVECAVPDDQLEAVWQLPRGQKVKVVGVVGRTEKDRVFLGRCQVTLLEPNPMPTLTAAELAAAYRADPAGAAKKHGDRYAEKWLFLTGEVAALTPYQYGVRVALKVPAGPKVEVPVEQADAAALKVGQAVRFKAACQGLGNDKQSLLVNGGVLPEAKTPLPVAK